MKVHELQPGRATILHPAWAVYKDYDCESHDSRSFVLCASEELAHQVAVLLASTQATRHADDKDAPIWPEHEDDEEELEAYFIALKAFRRDFVLDEFYDQDISLIPFAQELAEVCDEINFPYSHGHEHCASWRSEQTEAEASKIAKSLEEAIAQIKAH